MASLHQPAAMPALFSEKCLNLRPVISIKAMKRLSAFFLSAFTLVSCSGHFISDADYRSEVVSDFDARSEILDAAGISLDSLHTDRKTSEALEFLYAYMPLGDLMNQTPEFFLECCKYTMKAVNEMPWGKTVPERELRHFVLPPRVNNENLDGCRKVFFEELAPLVGDMTMYDAVLEVNHWCHEKASYSPSDSRTSAPLATVLTSAGRCGEESTLLVAALRSVGIPARQVYTPRWAHIDDNHAWVEAWVDGEWYFLGACEPEPVLNLGWFNAPASRGMLMNTNVFGNYDGPEEKLEITALSTRINLIQNYTPDTRKVEVKVVDTEGNAVRGAKVEYKIYNYAEFYSLATLSTNDCGYSSITSGCGDMLVYASDDNGNFGFAESNAQDSEALTIVLQYNGNSYIPDVHLDIVPPAENSIIPDVDDSLRTACRNRTKQEDSIRTAYAATFRTKSQAEAFANTYGLDVTRTAESLVRSCGNYASIEDFLRYAAEKGKGEKALRLLSLISEKDLHDTPSEVLIDHLDNCPDNCDDYIFSPRIFTELLRPWRGTLLQEVDAGTASLVHDNPAAFVNWCKENITVIDGINNSYLSVNPVRVWQSRIADRRSRDIFFVAMCRCFNVPAWIDPVTSTVKFNSEGKVYDVNFDAEEQEVAGTGTLRLKYDPSPELESPRYYYNFTISSFDGHKFNLLEYDENGSFESGFSNGVELTPGLYLLCTGIRNSSGEVYSHISWFTIKEGRETTVKLRPDFHRNDVSVIGTFHSGLEYIEMPEDRKTSILSTAGNGYYALLLIDKGSEPCVHALKDLETASSRLESWGRPILLVFSSREDYDSFNPENYHLPSNVRFGVDIDGNIHREILFEMKLPDNAPLPFVLMADDSDCMFFFSRGYSIGTGDTLATLAL